MRKSCLLQEEKNNLIRFFFFIIYVTKNLRQIVICIFIIVLNLNWSSGVNAVIYHLFLLVNEAK